MDDATALHPPEILTRIEQATSAVGFGMSSSPRTGALLRALVASKPAAEVLELGTGTGFSTAWMLDGLDADGKLDSVDNDKSAQEIARSCLSDDPRLALYTADGDDFIRSLVTAARRFDLIFADTWPGKLRLLEETLSLVKRGGFYVVDDMLPQPSWADPELGYDHPAAIAQLTANLEAHPSFTVTKLAWDTGIVLAVRTSF